MLDLLRNHPFAFAFILPIVLFSTAIAMVIVPVVLREVVPVVVANVIDSVY